MSTIGSARIKEVYVGSKKVKRIYVGSNLVYSAGSTVTYYVDSNEVYIEEVESGATCLSPTTFTPKKSGYTFIGWRQDTIASSDVLSSLSMDTEPVTLYAVFAKTITLTCFVDVYAATGASELSYYNNGNVTYPTFTVDDVELSGWTFLGWTTSTSATGTVAYSSINGVTISASLVLYAKFSKTITLSYSGNGATSGSVSSQSGTRYYSTSGNYSNPTFTLASNGYTKTNYSFTAWASGSTSGTTYTAGASVTLSASTTFYAIWAINTYTAKLEAYCYWSEAYSTPMVRLRLYNASTGSLIGTLYHSNTSGSSWSSSVDYFGLIRCTLYDTTSRPLSAAPPYIRLTALTTFYSNSGCTSVSLSSGGYTVFDVGYEGTETGTYTWYIPSCSYY